MSPADLDAALAAIEEPKAHLVEVRDEPWLARVYATPSLHRILPTAAAVRLAEWFGRLEWRFSAARRGEALDRAAAVLGASRKSTPARWFARRELAEQRALEELFWRPWVTRRMHIEGLEHLTGARAAGRGVILVTAHMGPADGLILALASRGFKLYLARYRKVEKDRVRRGRRARWTLVNIRRTEAAGCRWVGRGGSYPVFEALLGRGEVCWMPFDIPGSTPVTMSGRRFLVASGIAPLARNTGAPLVCGFALRDGHRARAKLLPPIEPGAFPTTKALHQHLAAIVGGAMFARPEQASPQIARLSAHAETAVD